VSVEFALRKVLNQIKSRYGDYPKFLFSDKGTEFYNFKVNDLLNKKNIRLYSVHSINKSAITERCIQTLRRRLVKIQYQQDTKDFLKLFPTVVSKYNSTVHSSTKLAPREILNTDTQVTAFQNLYGKLALKKPKKLYFKKGDFVKIAKYRLLFDKASSSQTYTNETFKISKCVQAVPVNY